MPGLKVLGCSELEERVTILDREYAPVAFLGDNPQTTRRVNYGLDPRDRPNGVQRGA
jgi:hypothetical protein